MRLFDDLDVLNERREIMMCQTVLVPLFLRCQIDIIITTSKSSSSSRSSKSSRTSKGVELT